MSLSEVFHQFIQCNFYFYLLQRLQSSSFDEGR
jgi:hypothetical protein